MARLIIGEEDLRLMAEKLQGAPVYAGPDGTLVEPGVQELLEHSPENAARWQPSNPLAEQMVLAGEACRDIRFHFEQFAAASDRARAVKTLSVPVCALMDVVSQLLKFGNDTAARLHRKSWLTMDQATYNRTQRSFHKLRFNGPVRQLRNKLGAHLDREIFRMPMRASESDLICAIGDSVVLLNLSLNYPAKFFGWIRALGTTPDGDDVIEIMNDYPIGVRLVVGADGRVRDVLGAFVAADPRHQLRVAHLDAIHVHNAIIDVTKSDRPKIWFRPSYELSNSPPSGDCPSPMPR